MTKPGSLAVALILALLVIYLCPALPQAVAADPPEPTDDYVIGTPISIEPGEIVPTYTGCGGVTAPAVNAAYEQEVVELVNAERAAIGRPPLKRVTELDRSARYFATDMGQDNYFPSNHNTYDRSGGSLVQVCTWDQRIQAYYPGWQMLAENIASGQTTPEAVMDAWMNSTGHRNNILSPDAWEIGVGYYTGGGDRYWVQDFGRRFGIYPIVINREAASTDSANVSLYIYGQGAHNEMRLRNDDGSWTGWQPFQSTLIWTLPGGAGEHTVWVELRDGSQTTLTSDSIVLTSTSPSLSLSTHSLTYLAEVGSSETTPANGSFTISNDGSDILHWTAGDDTPWLVLDSTAGDAPATVDVEVDNSGGVLNSLGAKTATITITATNPDATNSPQTIWVVLNVVEELYTIYLPMVLR